MACVELRIQQTQAPRERLADALKEMPEVENVENMVWVTGDFDALLRVRAWNTQHLQDVVFGIIAAGKERIATRTTIVLPVAFEKPGMDFERIREDGRGRAEG